jgi:hypothetical protein
MVPGPAAAPAPKAVRAGGINVEPGMRPWRWTGANPDGWWCRPPNCNGVPNGTAFVDKELSLAAALRVANVRVEFPWPLIEPERGRFDWRRADYIVHAALRRRVRLQPVLIYTPAWAAPQPNDAPAARDFAAYVRAVVRRYRMTIRDWELWDEPDLSRYWAGDQAAYVQRVLVPGARAARSASKRVRVILAASQQPDPDWLRGIYRLGGGASFDIVSYHDYSADRRVLEHASLLRDVLREQGQTRKPLWLGEYGVQESGLADVRQAALIQAVMTQPAPIALAQWYSLRDDYNMTCCPPRAVLFEPFGIVTHSGRRKQAFETMRSLLRR